MSIAIPSLTRVPAAERGITIADFLVPIRVGERISPWFRHVALIVAGALLIALSSLISIPVPGSPVPITGQTFAVMLVGGALGFRRGTLATLGYLMVGLFLPVYAQHASGIATIANGLAPFLLGDALKLLLAAGAFPAAWWVVGRRPGDR